MSTKPAPSLNARSCTDEAVFANDRRSDTQWLYSWSLINPIVAVICISNHHAE
jgi:hypothetical protein